MKKLNIQSINLRNYRNFRKLDIETKGQNIIFIGKNGTGKTNLLESISLLVPGRGLRSAALDDICHNDEKSWYSHFAINSKLGKAKITNNFTHSPRKRVIEYNGSKITNAELTNFLNIIWLTPQMDNIFLESASGRRRFLDRIVYNFYHNHAKEVYRYEHYVSERLRLLVKSGQNNISSKNNWLDILEYKIVLAAKNIFINRNKVVAMIQESINNMDSTFPKATLQISSLSDQCHKDYLYSDIQFNLETFDQNYSKILQDSRKKDSVTGKTNFGVHRNDFLVTHLEKNRLAKLCSTGEQKSMLISITLAKIEAIKKHQSVVPIMLLDELFVHLDHTNSNKLIAYILSSNMQVLITATDLNGIDKLKDFVKIIEL